MASFVTGATGFIGRHLVERLLARVQDKDESAANIYVVGRPESADKLESTRESVVRRLRAASRRSPATWPSPTWASPTTPWRN